MESGAKKTFILSIVYSVNILHFNQQDNVKDNVCYLK